METVAHGYDLTVWADATVLAEAKHLFTHANGKTAPIQGGYV
jgi:hypothetical protein